MPTLDKLVIKTPQELVDDFTQCVDDHLNDASLGLFRSLAKANPLGMQKLICKLQQLQLHIKAQDIHLITQALTDQLQIPHDVTLTIKNFLKEESKYALFQELQALSYMNGPQQRAILHIFDHLDIFSVSDDVTRFLRLTITMMMQWTFENNHRTSKDAAKWIKSILGIPYKSKMAQILNLIADHFHLSECLIEGVSRNMDCLELFFLLQNLSIDTNLVFVNDANKEWITHIHAAMLIVMIYKHSPHSFYDVIALEHGPKPAFSDVLRSYQAYQPQILNFFEKSHSEFTPYYSKQELSHHFNQDIFIQALITHVHTVVYSPLQRDPKIQEMKNFITICQKQFRLLDQTTFTKWLKMYTVTHPVESLMNILLSKPVCELALNYKTCNGGRIRASAMQLLTLGFSHRSASALATGVFQPLVNTEIATIDVKNMRAFAIYFQQQSALAQHLLTQEILIFCMMYAEDIHPIQTDTHEQKTQILTQFHLPSVDTVPQKVRNNPLQRNRLFSHTFTTNNDLTESKVGFKQ